MKLNPEIDRLNKYVSPFLKRVLNNKSFNINNNRCLDIPCGNGRNTFFLASQFKQVTAVDIDRRYLDAIQKNEPVYHERANIQVIQNDILGALFSGKGYDLICNIHFWQASVITDLLKTMNIGAFLLIETPGCQGENYKILPSKDELAMLFQNAAILLKEFNVCKHPDNVEKRGTLKILIKKC
jgi:2-polyprenyl-3-methyl-5-hydroxy-6-metoxy-1,4-benzoquinol methylase